MKHWLIAAALICFGSSARAQAVDAPAPQPPVLIGSASKLNLNLPINTGALIARDGTNGMWRAGGYVDPFGLSYGAMPIAEFGIAQSWTANHGYPGFGAHLGIAASALINAAQKSATGTDLSKLWKPLNTASSWVRLNVNYQHLQTPPGAGGKTDIWMVGMDVNVPVSIVSGWIEGGL
jgi:hypothetical protein